MRFSSGTEVLDTLLEGGLCAGAINTIYGPAASGKTTACMLAAIEFSKRGKKVIYIDTESGFSTERFRQLSEDYERLLQNIIFLGVKSFEEQIRQFRLLPELTKNPRIGLVIVDTIGSHYRSARKEEHYRETNNELAMQIEILQELAKNENLVVMMTNQVYADVEKIDEVVPVGGEIVKKRSGCMIELKLLNGSKRLAILICHPEITGKKEIVFEIVEKGFRKI